LYSIIIAAVEDFNTLKTFLLVVQCSLFFEMWPEMPVCAAIVVQRRGKKALILDPTISGSLTQLDAGLSELFTEHGIVKCVSQLLQNQHRQTVWLS